MARCPDPAQNPRGRCLPARGSHDGNPHDCAVLWACLRRCALPAGTGSGRFRGVSDPESSPRQRSLASAGVSEASDHAHGAGGHGHTGHTQDAGHGHTGHAHAGHGHGSGNASRRALLLALALTASFMVVEAAVGFITNSLALLADAGHMLADAGALLLALIAQNIAGRPRGERSTYGYRRAEVLAAFVNGIGLAVIAVLVLKEAVERWFVPVAIEGSLMLKTATLGLVVNLLVAFMLMGGRRDNINVRAAFTHVLFDALGSAAAILAGISVLYLDWL